MDRRTFVKSTGAAALLAATGGIARPAIAQNLSKVLRFVPQANLANLDPVWGTQYIVRNAAALVWDMLYGFDDKLTPQRQMVESEEASPDKSVWTFRLRDGLKFHDGEPVRANDAVASLDRWAARDPMGLDIKANEIELVAIDNRTFRWSLKKPYPKMLLALAKNNAPVAFIMPERIARTDPYKPISEYIGSGPMSLKRAEWVPGAKAVFEKFAGYVPRSEPSSWLAGGKVMHFDRIEWIVMPDAATASAALQNGEVDWWENPITDLVPVLKANKNIVVDVADPLGNIGAFRMNHLYPPFDKQLIRQAVLVAMDQADYMHAIVGDNDDLWSYLPSFFTPNTPLYTEAGGDMLRMRNIDRAKEMLKEASYKGEPVTCVIAQDEPISKASGDVTADLLTKMGMKVDFVATDWASVGTRRASKKPPAEGGWNMFHTRFAGTDCLNPAVYPGIRANDKGWFGWPKSDDVEAAARQWFEAKDLGAEKAAVADLNRAAMNDVIYAPTGFFRSYQAWRKNITGITKGPLPFFWGVEKV